MTEYILSIDQSTSCTKAMLFDREGQLAAREDLPHRQIVNEKGWVEHDSQEIYRNTIAVVRKLLESSRIDPAAIKAAGISNQRETSLVWDRETGEPYYNAIVWQCGRAVGICNALEPYKDEVKAATGMNLSPYFSAAKLAWVLQNVPGIDRERAVCSTIDSYLVYRLSGGKVIKTDYSNACRTQLLNIRSLDWDERMLELFGLSRSMMPEVADSDSLFCETDFEGLLPRPVPLHGVLGDSQAALFAQGCLEEGMVKATYGTGSSVMMNTGETICGSQSLVTSIAWKIGGRLNYVLEGNINYSGALTKWLVDDLRLISSSKEAGKIASEAKELPPKFFIIPAFSGLGAPYWSQEARAMVCGMDRTVGKAEFVRATEEAIALQINDVLMLMQEDTGKKITSLRTDGGPSNDSFLMQAQSDFSDVPVRVAKIEELSGLGAAYAAGLGIGFYTLEQIAASPAKKLYEPVMGKEARERKREGWKNAVSCALSY